ncbi:MAG: hypothetical protein AAGC82_17445 [Pseudomonadota bacterium]
MRRKIILTVALLLHLPGMSAAQSLHMAAVPGAEDVNFDGALLAWLSGTNDLTALQALQVLAEQDDNAAAQIMLARIAALPHLHGHVSGRLPPAGRTALFGQAEDLTGNGWLDIARTHSPLAQALIDIDAPETRANALAALLTAGETAIAARALYSVLFFDGSGISLVAALQSQERLPDEIAYLLQNAQANGLLDQDGVIGANQIPAGALGAWLQTPAMYLTWFPITLDQYRADPQVAAVARRHAQDVPSLAPLAAFCDRNCPSSAGACAAAGAAILARQDAMALASPSQVLLPDAIYWQSDRINADLLRLLSAVAMGTGNRPTSLAGYREIDACLVRAIEDFTTE